MWWMIAKAVVDGALTYGSTSASNAVVEANNKVGDAKASGDNRIRGAGNQFSAAKGALSRYMQSVSNNQALEAGGHALEANLINARRQDDTLSSASFEDQIKSAEQVGAQSAAAAFSGTGGEVADNISLSTRLMQQRAAGEAQRNRDFTNYDAARRAGVIQTQTVRSLDNSLILDSIDYAVDVAHHGTKVNPWLAGIIAGGESMMSSMSMGGGKGGGAAGGAQAASSWGRARDSGNYGGSI